MHHNAAKVHCDTSSVHFRILVFTLVASVGASWPHSCSLLLDTVLSLHTVWVKDAEPPSKIVLYFERGARGQGSYLKVSSI